MLTTNEVLTVPVGRLEELPLGLGIAVEVAGRSIAMFRTRSGQVYAVDNLCPHRGGPLADGLIAADHLVCPLHAFRFHLHSGECDQKDVCSVETYVVRIVDGRVHLELPGMRSA